MRSFVAPVLRFLVLDGAVHSCMGFFAMSRSGMPMSASTPVMPEESTAEQIHTDMKAKAGLDAYDEETLSCKGNCQDDEDFDEDDTENLKLGENFTDGGNFTESWDQAENAEMLVADNVTELWNATKGAEPMPAENFTGEILDDVEEAWEEAEDDAPLGEVTIIDDMKHRHPNRGYADGKEEEGSMKEDSKNRHRLRHANAKGSAETDDKQKGKMATVEESKGRNHAGHAYAKGNDRHHAGHADAQDFDVFKGDAEADGEQKGKATSSEESKKRRRVGHANAKGTAGDDDEQEGESTIMEESKNRHRAGRARADEKQVSKATTKDASKDRHRAGHADAKGTAEENDEEAVEAASMDKSKDHHHLGHASDKAMAKQEGESKHHRMRALTQKFRDAGLL